MRVLTLNCGSSSVKFSLFETSRPAIARGTDHALVRGIVERIGRTPSLLRVRVEGAAEGCRKAVEAPNHEAAIRLALSAVEEAAPGAIEAVGHRVVHGGPDLGRSRLIDGDVERAIEAAVDLAPLHNPHNLEGIRSARRIIPDLPNVAAFDTGFHRTIPPAASVYALPQALARKHALHRYGFHGLSHRYVLYRMEHLLGRARRDLRILSCHLGNGCSITAIEGGLSVETSMGFTPCEGLIMGTRPGDLDAGALLHLMEKENLTVGEAETLLNRSCGLQGLSGVSNDFREVLAARAAGNEAAALAIDAFCHRLRKYFGAYAAVLGRIDGIAFTGGVGENIPEVRARVLEGIAPFGVSLDAGANEEVIGREGRISPEREGGGEGNVVAVWVVPSDEELIIARDTVRCVEDAERMGDMHAPAPAAGAAS